MIIDGTQIAASIQKELIHDVKRLKDEHHLTPGLATILVGDDSASRVYVLMKKKACEKIGIYYEEHTFPGDAKEEEIVRLIQRLNQDERIHGILVQLPLPSHLDEPSVLCSITPQKDVDGFHPVNMGKLLTGDEGMAPCTPSGIITLLEKMGIEVAGKRAVVVGRSNIVGKPVALMLLNRDATVTICHSKTKDLGRYTMQADILVVAIGRAKFITEDMVKEGVAVIDVGINRVGGKLCGDVDFERVKKKASAITPVPGGVGPMTVAMLMKNTVTAAKNTLK
ncbi:MAG: bifunctional methylenetetrahydrofolate dehydrogenase/methenyltetrahydrofolate cyclohydrolase FolD [Methanosarcinales archaeon]|nr:MAG: bifunctional methylenetetrahydrofolate dehydrogenase/methenyltetrahydrofolate cyclohydrolase FolD [Methanosarcinales archaeon]